MLEGLLQTHEGAQRRVTNGSECIEAQGETSHEKSQNGDDKSMELCIKLKNYF